MKECEERSAKEMSVMKRAADAEQTRIVKDEEGRGGRASGLALAESTNAMRE